MSERGSGMVLEAPDTLSMSIPTSHMQNVAHSQLKIWSLKVVVCLSLWASVRERILAVSVTRFSPLVRGVENRFLGASELRSLVQEDQTFQNLQTELDFVTMVRYGGRLKL